jgi:hypothetical protein
VSTYSHLGAPKLSSEPAQGKRADDVAGTTSAPSDSDSAADRLKTALLVAAACASVLVGVVAARSLFLDEQRGNFLQAPR